MLRIVTVNAGDYLGRGVEYTNILFDSCRRNLPAGFEGEFQVFTDSPGDYHSDIVIRPLPSEHVKGWYQKLGLFRAGLFEPGDRIVFLDEDTLITGRLDEIVAYDGEFAILRGFLSGDPWQSAVMMWRAGFGSYIWGEYVKAQYPEVPGGDQAWIYQQALKGADILQDLFPDAFVSYKVSGGKIPKKASVVCFHGKPRPHEVTRGWVPEVWKIGGLIRSDLDIVCNTEQEKLLQNVRVNVARKLQWLRRGEPCDRHAVIVGGGPSVEEKVEEIRWRQSLGQEVWALNGSARWLKQHGINVDYHVIVDARPENVRFVQSPDRWTTYLIASQCDPALFALLSLHQVVVWHSNAPGVAEYLATIPGDTVPLIGGGSTVGLSAMVLASVMGFRFLHLYGYDSSVIPNAHHAYPQEENENDLIVEVMVEDGTRFRATPWMVQQANEFVPLAAQLVDTDAIEVITVAGEGLLPYLVRDMSRNPPVIAADIRAQEILSRLPGDGPVRGVEVGVFGGDLSSRLLQRADLELIMVDPWSGGGKDMLDKEDFHAKLTQAEQDAYYEMARARVAFAGERARIIRETSRQSVKRIPDRSLDFVFIDADHDYYAIKGDLWAWMAKLKPGALLSGHDYANMNHPQFGVARAVDEFVAMMGWPLEIGENFCWFVRLPETARVAAE